MKQLNSRGFSLVSVMVAVALLGGLSLAVMRIMKNISTGQGFAKNVQDQIELRTEIRMLLNDERYCRVSLAGDGAVGTPTTPVTFFKTAIDEEDEGLEVELFLSNQAGDTRSKKKFSSSDILSNKYGKLTISSLKLIMNNGIGTNYPDSTGDSDIGELHLRVSKSNGSSSDREILIKFLVNVGFKTSGGESTILSCSKVNEVTTRELKCYSLRRFEQVDYQYGFLDDMGNTSTTQGALSFTDVVSSYGGITVSGTHIPNTGLAVENIGFVGGVDVLFGMKCNIGNGFFMVGCGHASIDDEGDTDILFVENGCFAGDNDGKRRKNALDIRCCRYE